MNKIKNILIILLLVIIIIPSKAFAYTLSFDSNGGSGSMESRTDKNYYFLSTDVTNTYSAPDGKIFVGWSLTKNGTLLTNISLTSDTTIYAIWKTPITEANATINVPVGGNLPDIYPLSDNKYKYTTGGQTSLTEAKWSTNFTTFTEFSSSNTFVTGNEYTVYIAYRAADGYCFTDDTVYKINGQVATEFSTTGSSLTIRGAKYKFSALDSSNKVTANITINDYSTTNRGKFTIKDNINDTDKTSTSTLSLDLTKDSLSILYIIPESGYAVEKITLGDSELSYIYDIGLGKYRVTFNNDSNKNIVIYFKEKKVEKYKLTELKKDTDTKSISFNNKDNYISARKTEFINKINEFKTGKDNVTNLTDSVINSLFTEDKYAVITNIKYNDSSYETSGDLIAIGDVSNWDDLNVAQGWIEKTNNYIVEYTEVSIIESSNPQTGDNIYLFIILFLVSVFSLIGSYLYIKRYN